MISALIPYDSGNAVVLVGYFLMRQISTLLKLALFMCLCSNYAATPASRVHPNGRTPGIATQGLTNGNDRTTALESQGLNLVAAEPDGAPARKINIPSIHIMREY